MTSLDYQQVSDKKLLFAVISDHLNYQFILLFPSL